jgi:DNA-binding NarL/FixJ family response regulator
LIRGYSYKEIGDKLNLSARTIEDKISSIKDKMNCTSKSQVIEKALNKGYLNIFISELLKLDNISLNI